MACQLDGIFIGATRTRDMRNMMIVSLAVYLAAGYALMPVFVARIAARPTSSDRMRAICRC